MANEVVSAAAAQSTVATMMSQIRFRMIRR
jgi:hypothetical protein